MASASSIRYGGGSGSADALHRILTDLCTRGNPKFWFSSSMQVVGNVEMPSALLDYCSCYYLFLLAIGCSLRNGGGFQSGVFDGAVLALRKHVEEEARDLSGEAFYRFMDQLYDRIASLLESHDVGENLGALRAIDELIDAQLGESASKVSRFSNYMRTVFEVKRDPEILILASKVLGHLARAGGAMTADDVEWQVKTALDWLREERVEYRRFAAVLILKDELKKNSVSKEMAENASTVFNVHVPEFVDAIWVALRDPQLAVRERAVGALRACLKVIEKRETRWRVQWYAVENYVFHVIL
ncbi:hypothetical protein ACLOJK_003665 [Asimina triloba]